MCHSKQIESRIENVRKHQGYQDTKVSATRVAHDHPKTEYVSNITELKTIYCFFFYQVHSNRCLPLGWLSLLDSAFDDGTEICETIVPVFPLLSNDYQCDNVFHTHTIRSLCPINSENPKQTTTTLTNPRPERIMMSLLLHL